MSLRSKLRKEDVFKEGIILGLFLLVVGLLMIVVHLFIDNLWLLVFGGILIAIAVSSLFMVIYISFFNENKSEITMFIWNEVLYLLIGIPLASICILILPVAIYILMFGGEPRETLMFSVFFTLSLMISSLFYSAVKIWLENRSSGLPIPEKVDKGPIEQLLYKIPSVED
ncbi:MAG: hypothetical protein ACTSQF_13555 [Candidatus Heimdallarchaeaceae archaeon]